MTMMSSKSISSTSKNSCSSTGGTFFGNEWPGRAYLWPQYPLTSLFRLARFPLETDIKTPIPSIIFVTMTPTTGRKAGVGNYGKEETKHLLDILEGLLPIGPDEWNDAVEMHNVLYPGRDVDSVRRKFSTLYRKQIPTGDPNMPPDVRQAKRIKYKIGDKANVGDGEEEFDIEGGYEATETETTDANLAYLTQDTQVTTQASTQNNTQNNTQNTQDAVLPPAPAPVAHAPVARVVPPVRNLADDVAISVASRSSTTPSPRPPTKRSYTSRGSSSDFLEAFHMSLIQQQEARQQEREDRKVMMDAISAIAQGIATAFVPKKKKQKRKHSKRGSGNWTDSSNSDSSSI